MTTFEQMKFGPLGDAVEAIMPTSEADPIGVWAASLALYSSAISRNVRLDNRRPVVVWTVLAGRSAMGRKGYAYNTATALLDKVFGGYIYSRKKSGVSNGPTLVEMMSDTEKETVGPDGKGDGRAIIVEEEWAQVLKDQKKCSKFSSYFRTAWDGKPLSHRTKKEGLISVAQPLLGFHAHITPGEWAKYVSSSEALGGSYNRLLPVLVERSKMLPYKSRLVVPDVSELREVFEWAIESEERRVMYFSEEAGERFDEIRAEVEDKMAEMSELLSSYMERSAEQVHRISAVLASTEMTEEISAEAVEAAWAFVQHSMESVEKLVKASEKSNAGGKPMKTPEEMVREVLERHGGQANSSDVLRPLWGKLNAAGVKAAVEASEDMEWWSEKTGKRGAPSIFYRILTPEELEEKKREETKIVDFTSLRAKAKPTPKGIPVTAPVRSTNPFMSLL